MTGVASRSDGGDRAVLAVIPQFQVSGGPAFPARPAVEDQVGGEADQPGPVPARGPHEVHAGIDIEPPRQGAIMLAGLEGAPAGSVQHPAESVGAEKLLQVGGIFRIGGKDSLPVAAVEEGGRMGRREGYL